MELIRKFIDIVLHLDKYLKDLVPEYGVWIYAILFVIVFCETGLAVQPPCFTSKYFRPDEIPDPVIDVIPAKRR